MLILYLIYKYIHYTYTATLFTILRKYYYLCNANAKNYIIEFKVY